MELFTLGQLAERVVHGKDRIRGGSVVPSGHEPGIYVVENDAGSYSGMMCSQASITNVRFHTSGLVDMVKMRRVETLSSGWELPATTPVAWIGDGLIVVGNMDSD